MSFLLSKSCTTCNISKSLDQYWALKTGKHGKRARCIPCTQISKREYRANNKEKLNNYSREYNKKNWCWLGPHQKQYWKNNPEKYIEKNLTHVAKRRNRAPSWLSKEQRKEIQEFLKNKPENYQVDHILPLNGEEICGLHVPWNLQYLSKRENVIKTNLFDGTYENQSWKLKL